MTLVAAKMSPRSEPGSLVAIWRKARNGSFVKKKKTKTFFVEGESWKWLTWFLAAHRIALLLCAGL